ncbi:hypothetical protein DB354_12090 [Opitutus sp. ER46]|nr:hypothetical protein DB354_12090 [Opitutus sp. ER46]
MTVGTVSAQSAEPDVRQLQQENAALRKQLAELNARLGALAQPAPASTPAAASTGPAPRTVTTVSAPETAATTKLDDDTIMLSPFEVKSEKDRGYLKTNAVTATRIGAEIQNIPMNISVMSSDFIQDTGLQTITDILRYTASGSGDSRFAMRVPTNSATPQGTFTMRGFTVNSLLRNGVNRYVSHNFDNVERVEIVKGPAAVFFGQGYPGGVINYITKKPDFAKTFGSISYQIDDNGGDKATLDQNLALNRRAAMRVVGAWTDFTGDRRHEFRRGFNVTPSVTLVPFDSGKLKVNLEFEYLQEKFNENDGAWTWPQGWFDAYQNPSAALIAAAGVADAAAYKTRIFNNVTNYINDLRKSTNDYTMAIYTKDVIKPYGYWTNLSGKRIEDQAFNYTNSGAFTSNEVKTFTATVDLAPVSWMDARYVLTNDNSRFDNVSGTLAPNADGITFNWNPASSASAGYYRRQTDHQLDLIFKKDIWGTKQKLLIGGQHNRTFQQYMASAGVVYYAVPGYNYPSAPVNNVPNPTGTNGMVLINQVLRDRTGTVLTATEVYSKWDPAIHPTPPLSKLHPINRNLLDGYKPENESFYVNWQGQFFKDRLTTIAGYRKESSTGYGQFLTANEPWFITPPDAYLHQDVYPTNVYNYSASYAGDPENFRTRKGDSWMGGASFQIRPGLSVYASVSKTFKINSGLAGGFDELTLDQLLTDALTKNGGSFNYRGTTVTSVASGREALAKNGAFDAIPNESGMNYEIGVKTSLWDEKLVSTFSLFRGIRKNQKLDDSQKISSDPLNYSTTMFDSTSAFYGSTKRNFRWRTVGLKNQIEGAEFDMIWSPNRNYQAVINGAWLWYAQTVDYPVYPQPGTEKFNAATATNQALYRMYYDNRIENVPEFRLNVFNKYTFTDTVVRGLALALGARYSSETVYSRTFDWNPDRGGFMAGDFLVFDASVSYPWKALGYNLTTSLNIQNLTDKVYYEGTYVPANPRTWQLRTTLHF